MTDATTLLAGIKTRAEKATEGPWEVDRNHPFTSDLVGIFAPGPKHYILQVENQDDVDDPTSDEDIQFLAAARTDVPRLVAAIEAVAGLHKPETRWMPYDGAEVSYGTREEAIEACEDLDIGIAATVLVPFDLCAHCKTIEEGPCDGECTREMGYRESLWPCPTITAVVAALGGGE